MGGRKDSVPMQMPTGTMLLQREVDGLAYANNLVRSLPRPCAYFCTHPPSHITLLAPLGCAVQVEAKRATEHARLHTMGSIVKRIVLHLRVVLAVPPERAQAIRLKYPAISRWEVPASGIWFW